MPKSYSEIVEKILEFTNFGVSRWLIRDYEEAQQYTAFAVGLHAALTGKEQDRFKKDYPNTYLMIGYPVKLWKKIDVEEVRRELLRAKKPPRLRPARRRL